jgi:hypothetical protein
MVVNAARRRIPLGVIVLAPTPPPPPFHLQFISNTAVAALELEGKRKSHSGSHNPLA